MITLYLRLFVVFLIVTYCNFAFAIEFEEIKKRDFNNNGFIEPGHEYNAVADLSDELSGNQISVLGHVASAPGGSGLALDLFDDDKRADKLKNSCGLPQKFFLSEEILDTSVLNPSSKGAAGSAASFSITDNNLTNNTSWKVEGAATWVFLDACLTRKNSIQYNNAFLSGYALAPFIEFKGSGSSDNKGASLLRGGVKAEFQFFDTPIFQTQHISLDPYFQSDFDFQGDIYGLKATWTPYDLTKHLNGFIGANKSMQFWWTLNGYFDYLNVNDPGLSNLKNDTEYGWAGFRAGANFETKLKGTNGIFANAKYEAFFDVVSWDNDELLSTEIGLYLSENQHSSISIKYENGLNRGNFDELDQATIALNLSF